MAKRKGDKGLITEDLLREYFYRAGFFVVRGASVRFGDASITDVDIWVYERSATLARRRTIFDVKDKQRPQAAERLVFVLGLSRILGVEGAGVVTTDRSPRLRDLARKRRVVWINGDDLKRLKESSALKMDNHLSDEAVLQNIDVFDKPRGGRDLRQKYEELKSSVVDRFGAASGNISLETFEFLARETIKAEPNSESAKTLLHVCYLAASIAAASYDFASADSALRSYEDRRKAITNAIRFGEDAEGVIEKLDWVEKAISDYIDNGPNVAREVKSKFYADADAVPAEDLAEVIIKYSNSNKLFETARELERASRRIGAYRFDDLSPEARGFVGALLDFCGVERKKLADAVSGTGSDNGSTKLTGQENGKDNCTEDNGTDQKSLL